MVKQEKNINHRDIKVNSSKHETFYSNNIVYVGKGKGKVCIILKLLNQFIK